MSPEPWQCLHLAFSSLFSAAGVNWDCWSQAPDVPSWLRGGTWQELGLCAEGMSGPEGQ